MGGVGPRPGTLPSESDSALANSLVTGIFDPTPGAAPKRRVNRRRTAGPGKVHHSPAQTMTCGFQAASGFHNLVIVSDLQRYGWPGGGHTARSYSRISPPRTFLCRIRTVAGWVTGVYRSKMSRLLGPAGSLSRLCGPVDSLITAKYLPAQCRCFQAYDDRLVMIGYRPDRRHTRPRRESGSGLPVPGSTARRSRPPARPG